jgi:hypothetical protein
MMFVIKKLINYYRNGVVTKLTKYVVGLLFFLFLYSLSYAQNKIRDPFEPFLPQEKKGEETFQESGEEEYPSLPEMDVEGILWGTDKPLAVIDGEVYGVGDTLKSIDAKIFKIENNKIIIIYQGRLYNVGIKKRRREK